MPIILNSILAANIPTPGINKSTIFLEDGVFYHKNSTGQVLPIGGRSKFDLTSFYPGIPGASAIILRIPVAHDIIFADDFAGSYGVSSANATATRVYTIKANDVDIGTATFNVGTSTAVFYTTATTTILTAGDTISIVAPATADATLANIGICLAGERL
jgi:hypothetical protein